jgi:hypothetical protein
LAVELSARGARLVLGARRIGRLNALNAELGAAHLAVQADVARAEDCRMLIERSASHFGRIDTLVCNAGYGLARSLADTTTQEMRDIFATNVFGTTDCIRAAVPIMAGQSPRDGWRGQVMIVSSGAARRAMPYFGAYSATKAAQLSIAEALRVELRGQRIAVTSVHPVGTDTEFFATAEALSHARIPAHTPAAVRHTPRIVARRMVGAIVRPRPELWPMHVVRWGANVGVMLPRLADWVMSAYPRPQPAESP